MDVQERRILIVYASQSGGASRMAEAVERGAQSGADGVIVRKVHGTEGTLEDLLWCDALLIATPENFGYMAGAVKDFFDRTFYAAEGLVTKLPYALVVKAGNDGTFAIQAVQRIARGYGFELVAEPVLSVGELTPEQLARCEELGQLMSAGLELGVFGRTRRASSAQSTK